MPPGTRTSTTRLPAALREQIDQEPRQNAKRQPKQNLNRKAARKQERQEQKQRKAEFYSRPKATDSQNTLKRPANDAPDLEQAHPKKKPRTSGPPDDAPSDIPKSAPLKRDLSLSQGQHVPNTLKSTRPKTSSDRGSINKSRPQKPDDPESARIAWLESKLGASRSKSGKKPTLFGDGLDDLLDDLDRIVPGDMHQPAASEEESSAESEFSEFEGFEGFSVTGQFDHEEEQEGSEGEGETLEDADASHISQSNETGTDAGGQTLTGLQQETRYIPPQRREQASDDAETLVKLSRQLKGLLNRLSEQNMASILESVEKIYRTHRRNDITSTLTDLIIDGIASHSSLLDSFVVLHASLIASLYKIIGVELAAHFVQCLVKSYEDNYRAQRTIGTPGVDEETKGKECLNLVVLLSELYNFQVVSCVLVYDVIRGLLDDLDEFDVELLLKIVRNSGQQLRQDDPSALKDIILMVQTKMSTKDESIISSRTHFMIETLTNLKNNKSKRTTVQDGRSESAERMTKFISGLGKRHHILAHEPLRVSLDDLHSSEKKGKWWLVGSAWGGDPLLDRAQATDRHTTTNEPVKQASDVLLKLARKQGMNTDVRRSIFVVLMSSDDYVDACERLSQLGLTEIQQREIIRVILHCLGNEKLYNPYYTLVVQQLCKASHSYKVTLQFCLWDFLRNLGEKSVGGAEIIKNLQHDDPHIAFDVKKISTTRLLNVARAYGWWLAKGYSSLTILKPVDFTVLQPQSQEFFRALFSQLFISSQVTSPVIAANGEAAEHLTGARSRETLEEVMIKANRVPALAQALLYFLNTSLRGDVWSADGVVLETLKWAREVAKDTLRTGVDVTASLT